MVSCHFSALITKFNSIFFLCIVFYSHLLRLVTWMMCASFFSICQFLNFLLRCRHNQFPHVLTTEVFILRASLFEMQKLEWNWCAVRNETCCSSVCPSVQFQTSELIIPVLSFTTLTMNALKCCHFAFSSLLLLTIFIPRVCFYFVS